MIKNYYVNNKDEYQKNIKNTVREMFQFSNRIFSTHILLLFYSPIKSIF